MRIGDIVIPANWDTVLACGSGIYTHAIVASVEPFILVSEQGDMLWEREHWTDFTVLCQAHPDITKVAVARLESHQKQRERIKCAAIRFNGTTHEGPSHNVIGHDMLENKVCSRPYPGGSAQGFVTNQGRFVGRVEALQIAIEAGQVKGKTGNSELFSEDLKT